MRVRIFLILDKIYRKAALKLVQDLGEDAFPESKEAAPPDDASSRTADLAPESTAPASEHVESSKESTPTSEEMPLEPPSSDKPSETN
jgi:Lon-like ATP-dependent protease